MNLQSVINSRLGVGLALGLGRVIPPGAGYPLANLVAGWIVSRQNSALVRSIRANQWVVSQGKLSAVELDQVTRQALQHTAHCQYDLYHNLHNKAIIQRLIKFGAETEEIIERSQQDQKRLLIVGVHMSNFDFVLQAAALRGWQALVLAAPQPGGGYQMQNEIRRIAGLEIMPASLTAMRRAMKRLEAGGVVITGIDRPLPDDKHHPVFFGRPSALPVHHIHLAIKARVPVVVVTAITRRDRIYEVIVSQPIEMQPHTNRHMEVIQNAEAILKVAEEYICRAPYQWAMAYPVWPEVLGIVP